MGRRQGRSPHRRGAPAQGAVGGQEPGSFPAERAVGSKNQGVSRRWERAPLVEG